MSRSGCFLLLFTCVACSSGGARPPADSAVTGGGGGTPPAGGSGGTNSGGSGGTNSGGSGGTSSGGSGGASMGGAGGSAGRDGAADTASPDAAPKDAGVIPDAAPITECPGPSLDRLQKWLAHAFIAGGGGDSNILVQEGGRYVAKATFTGSGANWSELVVQLGNAADAAIDLSKSAGFTITYSATADVWIELRGTVKLHGGDQHSVKLPATGGMTMSMFVPFDPGAWSFVPNLGKPAVAFADVLKTANMFDIVANTASTLSFTGLRFDGYVPACR